MRYYTKIGHFITTFIHPTIHPKSSSPLLQGIFMGMNEGIRTNFKGMIYFYIYTFLEILKDLLRIAITAQTKIC